MYSVSVIIPNYNYARFLKRRLDSIINQTIKPAEIIFLDDCSTDNSIEVAQSILSDCNIPYRIITNEVNQGVFAQWLKGIELCQYDYFWIAEADDYCELNFLETLLPAFDDKDVVISYCKSNIINMECDEIYSSDYYFANYLDVEHWKTDYVYLGLTEVENYLSLMNTIPNVSAVVFNINAINKNDVKQCVDYKMCGDWMFYIQSLLSYQTNKIFYSAKSLNYFIRHKASIFNIQDNNKKNIVNEHLRIYQLLSPYIGNTTIKSIYKKMIDLILFYGLNSVDNKLLCEFLLNNDLHLFIHEIFEWLIFKNKEVEKSWNEMQHEISVRDNRIDEIWNEMQHEISVRDNRVDEIWNQMQHEISVRDNRIDEIWNQMQHEISVRDKIIN